MFVNIKVQLGTSLSTKERRRTFSNSLFSYIPPRTDKMKDLFISFKRKIDGIDKLTFFLLKTPSFFYTGILGEVEFHFGFHRRFGIFNKSSKSTFCAPITLPWHTFRSHQNQSSRSLQLKARHDRVITFYNHTFRSNILVDLLRLCAM